jgi:hypothetical protein
LGKINADYVRDKIRFARDNENMDSLSLSTQYPEAAAEADDVIMLETIEGEERTRWGDIRQLYTLNKVITR